VSLTFLLGGARSGKSALAIELASRWEGPVTFVATGEARDGEMEERIRLHKAERPAAWTSVEEPLELESALESAGAGSAVIVDCLSLWVANLLERDSGEIEARSERAAALAAHRKAPSIVVSNEVGLGVVPVSELGRRYRDVLGRVNTQWAAVADEAALVVAGRMLRLQ
jgi:adenosylcobinamide kinase / adenosylcobinamide-phosphate guanylyltransferase